MTLEIEIIPENLDATVVAKWVGWQNVIATEDLGHTFLVMTKNANDKRKIMRFFAIGDTTHCSVDFDEDRYMDDDLLFDLFIKRSK